MKENTAKIVIVGAGNVGSTIAYSIINQGLCGELILIDINHEKAVGEAMDLQHSVYFMNRNVNVKAAGYEECRDADLLIMTAAAPMDPKSNDRLKMLDTSRKIMKDTCEAVMKNGFDGIMLVVSNPVDIMAYYAWKYSGLSKQKVIGSGTTLDTARLAGFIGKMFDLDEKSVEAYVMAEHGDSEIVAWSTATIGGKKIVDVMKDNTDRTENVTLEDLRQKTLQSGWDIFHRKRSTTYGIASSVTSIAKSIIFNENRIFPVSVCFDGHYGMSDIYMSTPTIINHTGAKEIVEIKLSDEELEQLVQSSKVLKQCIDNVI